MKRLLNLAVVAFASGVCLGPILGVAILVVASSIPYAGLLLLVAVFLNPGLLLADRISILAFPLNGLIYSIVAITVDAAYRKFTKQR